MREITHVTLKSVPPPSLLQSFMLVAFGPVRVWKQMSGSETLWTNGIQLLCSTCERLRQSDWHQVHTPRHGPRVSRKRETACVWINIKTSCPVERLPRRYIFIFCLASSLTRKWKEMMRVRYGNKEEVMDTREQETESTGSERREEDKAHCWLKLLSCPPIVFPSLVCTPHPFHCICSLTLTSDSCEGSKISVNIAIILLTLRLAWLFPWVGPWWVQTLRVGSWVCSVQNINGRCSSVTGPVQICGEHTPVQFIRYP